MMPTFATGLKDIRNRNQFAFFFRKRLTSQLRRGLFFVFSRLISEVRWDLYQENMTRGFLIGESFGIFAHAIGNKL